MVSVNVTKLSSKGQIIIPQEMRKEFSVGDRFAIIKSGHQFIIKPVDELDQNFSEDLKFAKKTLEALKRYRKGEFEERDGEEFLAELEKW
ncbi:MAG: AbrB/MazE/SpoVT family DNA-binding domain-containing protein [Candidatus Altiarchaeota archaeon]